MPTRDPPYIFINISNPSTAGCLHPNGVLVHAGRSNASNAALIAMLRSERGLVAAACQQLAAVEADCEQTALFLQTLQGMLQHQMLPVADKLEGPHQQAFNRICNQVAGSDWQLLVPGQPIAEEPKFSTWDEVLNKQRRPSSSEAGSGNDAEAPAGPQAGSPSGVLDEAFYRLLGIDSNADAAAIKSAYRRKALQLHPDVNPAEDAGSRFAEVSTAYDTLSDPTSRQLYDRHGPVGMLQHQGSTSGRGNARVAWDEFKPFTRSNKHTQARGAVVSGLSDGSGGDLPARSPQVGDLVEYPLSSVVMQDLQDGRSHGVGLLVGRNMDRGDAKTLPVEMLGLCEIEPLRQEEEGSSRWVADELGSPTFPELHSLKAIPVAEYDRRHDVWVIEVPLSDGCGGPELPEEIML